MTQISKAFERAIKDNAFKNFQTIFRQALNEKVEENIYNELKSFAIPELTSRNIPSLQPQTYLHLFATSVSKAIEDMFHVACRTAKFQAYNVMYGKICEKTLERMNDEEFRTAQHVVITNYLEEQGTPAVITATMLHILGCFFAKNWLDKLIQTREESANEEFSNWMDTTVRETATTAFLSIMEETAREPAGQYKINILPQALRELNYLRTQKGDYEFFNEAIKHTYGAFATHKD